MKQCTTENPFFVDVTCENEEKVSVEIQKRAGEKSVVYVHVGGQTVFRLCSVLNENLEIKTPKEPCVGCQLTLDFHSGQQWNDDMMKYWKEKTGFNEATTRVLCDTIRRLKNEH